MIVRFEIGMKYALALVVLVFVGCRGGEAAMEGLSPAEGTISLDGKPVVGASVTFLPQAGGQAKAGYAVTGEDGSFKAQMSATDIGLTPGKYQVLLTKYTMPDGSPIPEGTSAADVGLNNALPARFGDPSMSQIYVDFPAADGQPVKLELRTR